jgi:hypothetical protein
LLNGVVTGALRLIGNRSPRENGGFIEEISRPKKYATAENFGRLVLVGEQTNQRAFMSLSGKPAEVRGTSNMRIWG